MEILSRPRPVLENTLNSFWFSRRVLFCENTICKLQCTKFLETGAECQSFFNNCLEIKKRIGKFFADRFIVPQIGLFFYCIYLRKTIDCFIALMLLIFLWFFFFRLPNVHYEDGIKVLGSPIKFDPPELDFTEQ